MRTLSASCIVLVAAIAITCRLAAATPETQSGLSHCLVSLIEEAQVPAQEAGVILKMNAREGQSVKKDELLAQMDDAIPQSERRKAIAEQKSAKEKAESDVDVRYAKAASGVAKFAYLKATEANDKVKNAVQLTELKRLQLEWQRADLQIEQAELERRIAALTADTKQAEVDAADEAIRHRQIKSPLDGIIVQVNPHLGEWVKPGDTVLRVVRMDRLRVEAYLSTAQFSPQDVRDRKIIVSVSLAKYSQPVQFRGEIVFVSPLDEAGSEYRVWAEVENRHVPGRSDDWLLRPGATVSMQIE